MSSSPRLERNVFVADGRRGRRRLGLGRALVEIISRRCSAARASGILSTAGAFAASAEQNQIVGHDFRHVLLLVCLFIIPRPGLQAALDVDLAALFQIFARDFRQALPQDHVVPLGAVLPLAVLVLVALVGGQRKFRDRRSAGRVFHFGIFTKIADEDDFIDALSCHKYCSFCPYKRNLIAWPEGLGTGMIFRGWMLNISETGAGADVIG